MTTGFSLDVKGKLWIYKAPEAVLSYTLDLNDPSDPWLASGETITTLTFTLSTPPDAALTISAQTHTNTTGTVQLTGGTAGKDYIVLMTWTTSNGNTDSRYFIAKVRTRSAG